ncbi:MAG: glycosyltransferase [Desulfobacteraceae bacterium]|nr:glycosyltransferase [Desulfobacteraceae bacterium]
MENKNVLIFLNAFWNNGAGMSGGDQMFIQVFKRIRNDLGLLWCVTNLDGKAAIEKEVPRVTFKISPHGLDRLNLMVNYVMRTLFAMRCLVLKPDVVYAGSDFFPDVIPTFLLKLIRPQTRWIQCVFHIYPDWRSRPGSKIKSFIAQYMQRFSLLLARRADVVLNINQGVKNYLVAKGFTEEKIIINPPGIDLDYLRGVPPAPQEEGYDGIFLGRLNPSKGIFDLVKIWALVVKKIPSARLAIIGGGSAEIVAQLKEAIREKRIEGNISLLGYLENDKAFALIKASKVFLFPSREEGFGIAIAEALACGVPVVAWDLPVFEEFFPYLIKVVDCYKFEHFARLVIDQLQGRDKVDSGAAKELDKFSWRGVSSNICSIISGLRFLGVIL